MYKLLCDVEEKDKIEVGKKAFHCAIMLQNNMNVPDGFVLFGTISKEDILKAKDYMKNRGTFVVRSSMSNEDNERISMAGKFLTLFDVTIDGLEEAMEQIYHQAGNGIKKAVLVQTFIRPEISGVVFTKHPLSGKGMLLNAAYGIGENVVSGLITPDEFEVYGDEIKSCIKQKVYIYTYGKEHIPGNEVILNGCRCSLVIENEGKQLLSVHYSHRNQASLNKKQIVKVRDEAIKIRTLFQSEQDIEFLFDNNELYILQARPITVISNKKEDSGKIENRGETCKTLIGEKVSNGRFQGEVVKLQSFDERECFSVGVDNVVVTNEFYPELLYVLDNISALVTAKGGKLSHAAIVCRERGIPCVTGIEGGIDEINTGDNVFVDATNGKVVIYE